LVLVSLLFISPILSTSNVISSAFTTTQSGQGTYYGPSTSGACGYGSLFPSFASSLTKVALSTAMYQGNDGIAGGCGVCIQMQGTGTGSGNNPISKTPQTVFAHDLCGSGCATGSLDLAVTGDGSWGITWKAVVCPVGSEKLKYKFEGSNPYYLKVQVVSNSLPLSKVEFVVGSTTYPATHTSDNYWTSSSVPPPTFPLSVNVYSTAGEKLSDQIPSLTNGVLLNGVKGVQFSGTSGLEEDQSAVMDGNLDTNMVIGISVGCVVLLVVVVAIIVVMIRRRRSQLEVA